jgi:hypothetical protein
MAEEIKEVVPPAEAPPKVEEKKDETLLGEKISEGDKKVSEPPKEEAKKEADKADKPKEEKVVPDKYELKLPEGSNLSPARLEKIALYAKEQGLSNQEAQRVLERESDAVSEFSKNQTTQYESKKAEWLESCKADTEFGGEALKENVLLANNVIAKYGSQQLREQLDLTGLGNHPELMRMIVKIGKEMGPDKLVVAGAADKSKPKPTAHRVWGYMNEGKDKAS